MLRNQIEDGSRVLADPEQVVSAMYGDIQAAEKLLAELREAYRRLPQHIQVHIACLLRDSTPQNTTRQQACELTLRAPGQS